MHAIEICDKLEICYRYDVFARSNEAKWHTINDNHKALNSRDKHFY